jgi:hypothetical protein
MQMRKVAMDSAVTAEDQSGTNVFRMFQTVQNFHVNAAAPEAINNFGRHVWMKQRSCNHLRNIQSD